jgi:hypothetical protein
VRPAIEDSGKYELGYRRLGRNEIRCRDRSFIYDFFAKCEEVVLVK